MTKAIWNDVVVAESNATIIVEGNHYFPPESIQPDYFINSDTHSSCFWKGQASYYHIKVNDEINQDAAWYYPEPKAKADNIKSYVAFWKGVEIIDD